MVFGLLRLLLGTVMIDVLLFFSVLFFLEDSHTGVLAIHEAGRRGESLAVRLCICILVCRHLHGGATQRAAPSLEFRRKARERRH